MVLTNQIIQRNWNIVAQGIFIPHELECFLKEIRLIGSIHIVVGKYKNADFCIFYNLYKCKILISTY